MCSSLPDSISITVLPLPIASIAGTTAICAGSNSTLEVSGGTFFSWNNGFTTPIITVNPAFTTTYYVTVNNGICNSNLDSITVNVTSLPIPVLSPQSATINQGENIILSAKGGAAYIWTPSAGLSCTNCSDPIASPTATTVYTVNVISIEECVSSISTTITVENNCDKIFVPNVFTPNSAQSSSTLDMRIGECIGSCSLRILNLNGDQVYETNDMSKGWNGVYNGQLSQQGIFVYFIHATLKDGTSFDKNGSIALFR